MYSLVVSLCFVFLCPISITFDAAKLSRPEVAEYILDGQKKELQNLSNKCEILFDVNLGEVFGVDKINRLSFKMNQMLENHAFQSLICFHPKFPY